MTSYLFLKRKDRDSGDALFKSINLEKKISELRLFREWNIRFVIVVSPFLSRAKLLSLVDFLPIGYSI